MKRCLFGVVACGLGAAATITYAADPPEPANLGADQAQVAEANFQRQLDQFQYNSRLHVNEDIPPDQRVLVDYGAYATFNFLSVDDPNGDQHVLRETDLIGYADVNLDLSLIHI